MGEIIDITILEELDNNSGCLLCGSSAAEETLYQ